VRVNPSSLPEYLKESFGLALPSFDAIKFAILESNAVLVGKVLQLVYRTSRVDTDTYILERIC
jgi:hypothetical protein